jgi:phospholipid/cholesterol/gamma-HCH transport system permease protein
MPSCFEVSETPEAVRVVLKTACTRHDLAVAVAELGALAKRLAPARAVQLELTALRPNDHLTLAALAHFLRLAGKRPVSFEGLADDLVKHLREVSADLSVRKKAGDDENVTEYLGRQTWAGLAELRAIVTYLGELVAGMWVAARHPTRIRWGDTLYYMMRNGGEALPIVSLICLLMGIILGFQAAVQLHKVGADAYVADLVGLSIVKELGPLMVAMICTGRAGSAFAAEIGTMKVAEEVDALITMGLDPQRFLVVPKVLALLMMLPLLTIFGNLAGVFGGGIIGVMYLELPWITYYQQTVARIEILPRA